MKTILQAVGSYLRKLDRQLIIACTACGLFSVVLLYAIIVNDVGYRLQPRLYKIQLLAVALGVVCAFILSGIDYHKLAKLWFLYAPAGLALSLLTFTPLGYGVAGADDRAWLDVGFISFQPADFLKVAFILSFAYHLSKVEDHLNRPLSMLLLCIHGAIPVLLVAAQGDHGTCIVFLVMFAIMLFSAGISWKYIVAALIALPVGAVFAWNFILQPVHKNRILVLLDPSYDSSGDLLRQQNQGLIALGSGQLFGKGLFGGDYSYVAAVQTDFIFTWVGQTCGFVGCMLLVGVLTFICMRILSNSRTAKDSLGKHICTGTFAMFFIHCFLNLGMCLKVLPVIGVPLPLTSGGGTSMLSMFLAIGLVLSTYSHSSKNRALFYDAD